MNMNGTYQQPRRGYTPRPLKRNAAGQFITPGAERVALREARLETLKEKAERITDIMLTMTGVSRDKFLTSREYPLPQCRAILYDDLYKDGYGTNLIGRVFGKNHATVIHGRRVIHDLLTIGDREIRALQNQYNELINQAI